MAKKVAKANQGTKKTGGSFFQRYKWELIIFTFSVLLYANSVPNGYNMDDELVTINHRLTSKGISAIPEIFTTTYYKDDAGYAYEYRPMVLATFAIEHQVFSDNPFVSHLINVLLYGLCCVLLYHVLLLATSGLSVLIPVAIALLFAAHPAHTEVVSSIKNRDEILGLIFSFLTCLVAFRAVNKSIAWFVLVPVFFTAALMSKMSVLPFTLIIPVTLILFSEVGFKKVAFISFLLALASFIVMNNLLYEKLIIAFSIMAAAFVLYVLLRFNEVMAWVQSFVGSVLAKPLPFLPTLHQNFLSRHITGFLSGALFNFTSYLSPKPIAMALIAAAIYITAITTAFPLLILFAAVAFFVLLFFGNEKTIWWARVLLYSCFAITLYKFHIGVGVFSDLFTICIAYQLLYGDRKLLIPSALIFISLFFLEPVSSIMSDGVIVLVGFRWLWTLPLAVVFTATGLNSSIHNFYVYGFLRPMTKYDDEFGIFMAIFIVVSLLLKKGTSTLISAFQLLAILTLFSMNLFYHPVTPKTAGHDIKVQIYKFGKKVSTNLIGDKVDRPIDFVEQPVTSKSPLSLRTGTALEILFIYLHKVVIPYPMSFYYGYRFIEPQNISESLPILSLVLYLILSGLTLFFVKRNKVIGFGLLIYLISIAAVSTLFFPIPGQLGERFLLIPSLGWCIVFVAGISSLLKPCIAVSAVSLTGLPKVFKYSFFILLSLYSVITFSRNFDWKDYTTLSQHDIGYVENSSQANNLTALNLMKHSYELQDPIAQKAARIEALAHFRKALEIYPRFYNVNYDIARVFNVLGQNDSSIAYFKKAIAIDSTNPNPALFIGQMLVTDGKYADAIPYLQFVINHQPGNYDAFDRLSFVYYKLADYKNSIAVNQAAIATLPPQTGPYLNIAHVYIATHQSDSARAYLLRAQKINPNDQSISQILRQMGSQ